MESRAILRYCKTTPRKARVVADAVKGRMVGDALSVLRFGIGKAVAVDVSKTIKSAVANMQSRHEDAAIDIDSLRIKEIRVDEGPVLRRFRARAQGRVGRRLKRMCHITVAVSD